MEQLIKDLLHRLKKSIPIIIVIPLILGALGYFLQMEAKPVSTYKGEAKIKLGYYEDMNLNDSDTAKNVITSHSFLEKVLEDYDEEELHLTKNQIGVETPSDSRLNIAYEGKEKEEVMQVLSLLVTGFLDYDNERYDERVSILEENFQELKEETVNEASKVEKQRFVYELQNELLTIYPAELTDPVSVNEYRMEDFSPKNRAILGVMVGMTMVFGYLVIPILFREEDYM